MKRLYALLALGTTVLLAYAGPARAGDDHCKYDCSTTSVSDTVPDTIPDTHVPPALTEVPTTVPPTIGSIGGPGSVDTTTVTTVTPEPQVVQTTTTAAALPDTELPRTGTEENALLIVGTSLIGLGVFLHITRRPRRR